MNDYGISRINVQICRVGAVHEPAMNILVPLRLCVITYCEVYLSCLGILVTIVGS